MKIDKDGYLIYEEYDYLIIYSILVSISLFKIKETATLFFINSCSTINGRTTYTDPRLAFAVSDSVDCEPDPDRPDEPLPEPTSRQLLDSAVSQISRFDSWSTALQILDGVDLSDKHAVITGGTRYLFRTVFSVSTLCCNGEFKFLQSFRMFCFVAI